MSVNLFGGSVNEALIILGNGHIYALGFNGYDCLGISDEKKLEPKKIETLCQKDIIGLAYGTTPHVLAVTALGELYSWVHGGYSQLGHNDPKRINQCWFKYVEMLFKFTVDGITLLHLQPKEKQ